MIVRGALIALIAMLSLSIGSQAWAYRETDTSANPTIRPEDCASCHAVDEVLVGATEAGRQGPHGNYSTSSRACAGCHLTHGAPAVGYVLLPGYTMTETCELCHDGTGGKGVYGAIEASLGQGSVQSAHRTETGNVIPGGSSATGGEETTVFSGQDGSLSCGDCHTPHGAGTVQPFTTDRRRIATDTAGFYSNQLLRTRPRNATTETPLYGSDWCTSCHAGRSEGLHSSFNHPVDTSATVGPGAFTYQNVQVVASVNSTVTQAGALGGSNFGYVMPWERTAGQGTHKPICQQCHEDARSVGDQVTGQIAANEVFTVTTSDGGGASDNPQFQVFPHESQNPSFIVESDDDLCTNCHHSDQLP